MRLLRYGPAGQEKPGLLDNTGTLRDLSGVVPDIAGDVLLPESLERLRQIDPATLPKVPMRRASARASAGSASSSASV